MKKFTLKLLSSVESTPSDGNKLSEQFSVDLPPQGKIGRHHACTLPFAQSKQLSGEHLEFECEDESGTVRIVDLRSKNGTFVNGKRITEARLRHGDKLRLASLTFRLLVDEGKKAASSDPEVIWI